MLSSVVASIVAALAYVGRVSTNALNINGVAIVTALPANMSVTDATTRCLIPTASSLSGASALSGNAGHTCLASSLAILQFLCVDGKYVVVKLSVLSVFTVDEEDNPLKQL